ncbi:UvrD-helicase domain-containing protein, partial [Vibrio vulnificus]|uniref:UvrD-helicase domain-containing protein n=1 Tax=Vibrio vulnificus TaxID=672 RepID=UPI00057E029E
RSYSKKSLPEWLDTVSRWAESDTFDYRYPDKLAKFAQSELLAKTAKCTAPTQQLFDQIDAFLANPASLKAPLLAHGIEQWRAWLAKAKEHKQRLSFDDLLTRLSAAIDQDEAQLLASRIRTLYPVAMIDEFQDTDPLQYSIFSRIYLDHPQTGLFMIGD